MDLEEPDGLRTHPSAARRLRVSAEKILSERSPTASVVIPSYNMGWCLARAVKSCQSQSRPAHEIIVVDDCSTDDTEHVVGELMPGDSRIKYLKQDTNHGHLGALAIGIRHATSDWVALLDADDELTPTSIECRIGAATAYSETTGITPQLIYGDQFVMPDSRVRHFMRLEGDAYPFLSRELCLCQTSTIMLGKSSLPYFPVSHTWMTDDEIVLAVGRRFHVLHAGEVVTIYHDHKSPTKMSSNARRVFRGVCELVRDHRQEVLRTHGVRRLLLWYLRMLKAFLGYQIEMVNETVSERGSPMRYSLYLPLRLYRRGLYYAKAGLGLYLRNHFELDYF
jgi:glycosyltransferase involved in cell wall biosynthesis